MQMLFTFTLLLFFALLSNKEGKLFPEKIWPGTGSWEVFSVFSWQNKSLFASLGCRQRDFFYVNYIKMYLFELFANVLISYNFFEIINLIALYYLKNTELSWQSFPQKRNYIIQSKWCTFTIITNRKINSNMKSVIPSYKCHSVI